MRAKRSSSRCRPRADTADRKPPVNRNRLPCGLRRIEILAPALSGHVERDRNKLGLWIITAAICLLIAASIGFTETLPESDMKP
jgi:hypothetical protein